MSQSPFSERISRDQVELGNQLAPEFNDEGLIPCITVDADSGELLMFAWMNREALIRTLDTGKATYYSRSRKKIWVKGEMSGHSQKVEQIRVDCDQDVLQLLVRMEGAGACHTGHRTCFYRSVANYRSGKLEFIEKKPLFDPEEVYRDPKKVTGKRKE